MTCLEAPWKSFFKGALFSQSLRCVNAWCARPSLWKNLLKTVVTHSAAENSQKGNWFGTVANTLRWACQATTHMWLGCGWKSWYLDIPNSILKYLRCCGLATKPFPSCTAQNLGFWPKKRKILWKSLALRSYASTCPWPALLCNSINCCGGCAPSCT